MIMDVYTLKMLSFRLKIIWPARAYLRLSEYVLNAVEYYGYTPVLRAAFYLVVRFSGTAFGPPRIRARQVWEEWPEWASAHAWELR